MEGMFDPAVWKADKITIPLLVVNTSSPMWTAKYVDAVRAMAQRPPLHDGGRRGPLPHARAPRGADDAIDKWMKTKGVVVGSPRGVMFEEPLASCSSNSKPWGFCVRHPERESRDLGGRKALRRTINAPPTPAQVPRLTLGMTAMTHLFVIEGRLLMRERPAARSGSRRSSRIQLDLLAAAADLAGGAEARLAVETDRA